MENEEALYGSSGFVYSFPVWFPLLHVFRMQPLVAQLILPDNTDGVGRFLPRIEQFLKCAELGNHEVPGEISERTQIDSKEGPDVADEKNKTKNKLAMESKCSQLLHPGLIV